MLHSCDRLQVSDNQGVDGLCRNEDEIQGHTNEAQRGRGVAHDADCRRVADMERTKGSGSWVERRWLQLGGN